MGFCLLSWRCSRQRNDFIWPLWLLGDQPPFSICICKSVTGGGWENEKIDIVEQLPPWGKALNSHLLFSVITVMADPKFTCSKEGSGNPWPFSTTLTRLLIFRVQGFFLSPHYSGEMNINTVEYFKNRGKNHITSHHLLMQSLPLMLRPAKVGSPCIFPPGHVLKLQRLHTIPGSSFVFVHKSHHEHVFWGRTTCINHHLMVIWHWWWKRLSTVNHRLGAIWVPDTFCCHE